MTAPIDQNQFKLAAQAAEDAFDFQAKRGEFIDSFCALELAVGRWLMSLGSPHSANLPFGQRLEKLSKHENLAGKAGPNQTPRIQRLTEECAGFMEIRNALVHSHRAFGMMEGFPCVMLQNITDHLKCRPQYTVMTQADIDGASKEIAKLAGILTGWLKQVSQAPSPQRPAPDATGGP